MGMEMFTQWSSQKADKKLCLQNVKENKFKLYYVENSKTKKPNTVGPDKIVTVFAYS